jgi:hypothetical protein
MILKKALSREGFIRQRGNPVRELRHIPEGGFEPVPVELGGFCRNMGSVFTQACGIRLRRVAPSGVLARKIGLNLRPDINSDCHVASWFSRYRHPDRKSMRIATSRRTVHNCRSAGSLE